MTSEFAGGWVSMTGTAYDVGLRNAGNSVRKPFTPGRTEPIYKLASILGYQCFMFTRGLMSWGDNDWLGTRVDKWVAQCQGYSKLRGRRLSKGCQTMLDRPSSQNTFWSHTDSVLPRNDNEILAVCPVKSSNDNENEDIDTLLRPMNSIMLDQDIEDYIAYLNRPIINMNDHYIEIHQYHYEPSNLVAQDHPIRPPARRKKNRIDLKKTEIVDTKGISTIKTLEYSDFLVKKGLENQSIKVVSGRSSDEENKNPDSLDHHRPLSQSSVVPKIGVDTVVSKEGRVKVKRGQTFSAALDLGKDDPPHRGFMSFRSSKKNKSGRRKKKVIVGENGVDGPIWPAVLLTFDRSISPGPPESPDESEV